MSSLTVASECSSTISSEEEEHKNVEIKFGNLLQHCDFKENHGLDGLSSPFDVDQEPADLIFLSFSDSDLGAFAAGWQRAKHNSLETDIPSLRLANLSALAHPLSVNMQDLQIFPRLKRRFNGESPFHTRPSIIWRISQTIYYYE